MEIEGEDGTKLMLKPGDKTVFGRGAGFTTDDLTVSRRHVSLELKPLAGGTDRVSFEVLGRNPVWVRKREPGGKKIRTFRKSETGEIAAGDRFCVSGQLPVWFTLTRSDDGRASGGESGLDCTDIDPVKEFGFLVIGKEFDQYPKNRIRDVKQWEWFLEDSSKGNSDDDDDGDKKGRKGLSKKRKRRGKKGNEEDDDWSVESEEDKELMVKSKRVLSPTYSTRSKKTKKDIKATSSSSGRAQTKQRGRVDIDEDEDEDDETLGGFIVSDEEAELEEEDEDDEELVEDDEDED